ncbi:PREDICTED: serine protease snake-like [Drosophila arizonae]|uniref:Serine protease snake-like n=1 Tax=Drosophila arizonae TaxID=7263 RepID=A0ABM1PRN3_DROAR|nr:PREDICTED: serine protease snake-like [Drosophila arizonae]
MPNALLLFLLGLAMATPSGAAAAQPAIRPQSQRGIIFPKETFDECFLDGEQKMPGSCKLLQDCPAAIKQAMPKTCYFVKFDQYVCCASNSSQPDDDSQVEPTTLKPPVKRKSDKVCEEFNFFVASVVGGRLTKHREFPFMAALGWRSNFDQSIYYRCGGSLIAPNFVLTAAHCIDFGGQRPVIVRLGGDNLTVSMDAVHHDYRIRRIFIHPGYNENTAYNDIALLELEGHVPPILRPVCLWQDAKLAKKDLIAVGYGQISFAGLSSSQLLKVDLQHISNDQCREYYSREQLPKGLAASQVCAGDLSGKADTCQGDSGGPLVMRLDGSTWYLVGITSLGQGCAIGPPSIYTRVSSYLDWIESIVWPQSEDQTVDPTFDLRISF